MSKIHVTNDDLIKYSQFINFHGKRICAFLWLVALAMDILWKIFAKVEWKNKFDIDLGAIVTVPMGVTTISMAIMIFYVGIAKEKNYGIQIAEIYLFFSNLENAIMNVVVFSISVIFLLISLIFHLPILMVCDTLVSIGIMMGSVLMVYISISQGCVVKIAQKQFQEVVLEEDSMSALFIHKMLLEIENMSEADQIQVVKVLAECVMERAKKCDMWQRIEIVRWCGGATREILCRSMEKKERYAFLLAWWDETKIRKNICFKTIKEGIIYGLLSTMGRNEEIENFKFCFKLIDEEDGYYNELVIWTILVNLRLKGAEGNEWRYSMCYCQLQQGNYYLENPDVEKYIAEYKIIIEKLIPGDIINNDDVWNILQRRS